MSAERPESRYRPVASKEELRAMVADRDARMLELFGAPGPGRGLEFLDAVERYLDLDRWGFAPTRLRISDVAVIYDSPRCRVKLWPTFNFEPGEGAVYCEYGQLDVPDEPEPEDFRKGKTWDTINSQEYYWFLEGYTPEQALESWRAGLGWPAWQAFLDSELGRTLHGIEWWAAGHGFLWEYYGERLFSLFDLRQPERREAYWRFRGDFRRLRGREVEAQMAELAMKRGSGKIASG